MSNEIPAEHISFLKTYGNLQPSKRFSYVTIHPLADETSLLKKLSLAPEKCVVCDLYWAIGSRLAFVSVWGGSPENPSAVYWEDARKIEVPHKFVVHTKRAPLTSSVIENVLGQFAAWLKSLESKPPHPGNIVRIVGYAF